MEKLFYDYQERLHPVVHEFPWEDREKYKNYLAQTYYYVRHSTRLLAASACRFDHANEALHLRFLKHAREENAHDVLALKDLTDLGGDILNYPEHPVTMMLYQPQYYQVSYIDPVCLFGYIFALEGVAHTAGEKVYDRLIATYGKTGTTFLKLHAHEDHDHIKKAFESIKSLPNDKKILIENNFMLSMDALNLFFTRIAKESKSKSIKAA